ncbi:MAG: tRNA1(Val) (adenine(37)-N6)-methyltransferase [Parabacteroides sp.]|nr:tRNA1(Val) (adenine(37)-N6)-methyltransferase [Parabacteroides sp.]
MFQFKQFTIHHDRCAMKVGTDGVLLGAWANVIGCQRILDVGTGTGLIALMLAQRSSAQIHAIDIDEAACLQATENVANSPFSKRVEIIHKDLETYCHSCSSQYDLIVSNPPYFVDSLKCPDRQRNTARHTDTLSLESLLRDCHQLLTPKGVIALILPYDRKESLLQGIGKEQLFLSKEVDVVPVIGALPKRMLIELRKEQPIEPVVPTTLTIEIARHQYTEAYIELTKAFYLKM